MAGERGRVNGDSAGVVGKVTFGQGVAGDEGVGRASTRNANLRAKGAASAKARGGHVPGIFEEERAAGMAGAEFAGWRVTMDGAWGPAERLRFEDYSKKWQILLWKILTQFRNKR